MLNMHHESILNLWTAIDLGIVALVVVLIVAGVTGPEKASTNKERPAAGATGR